MFPPCLRLRPRTMHALPICAAAVVIALAGAGAAQATWSTSGSTTASVVSGMVGVSQSGFDQLAIDYSANVLSRVKPITITNGNVPATYTAVLGVASASSFASAVTVRTWLAAASTCVAGVSIPAGATTGTWTTGTQLIDTLDAGESASYCVSTTLPSAGVAAYAGQSLTGQLKLSAAVGTSAWTIAVPTVTARQALPDTTAPPTPGRPCIVSVTDASVTMQWNAPESGTLTYKIYRGTVFVGQTTATTFTDTGLSVGTTYSYTISASDLVPNESLRSSAAVTTTDGMPSPSQWYQVKNGTLCVAGGSASGDALTLQVCDPAAAGQRWQYDTSRYSNRYSIYSQIAPSLVWDRNGAVARTKTYNSSDVDQQWAGSTAGDGRYSFSNGSDGACLYAPAATTGTQLKLQTCSSSAAQKFVLTRVG
ncbi:hypothetical protein E3T55_03630 [Cryobacterium frigoriphilum]|uniref:Fibronectin type-III domain-containing protein n=1 Tax=Cryobacterium frigoriphilum TaxID=1259150 RepID=A0A4V3IS14_9MICO|nr:RICIN domain-containing protein [Cryobacterium frigoriphilum]TFD54524.1 hypothetical protein E3T55_03630 [Cryobacterium frigoriphilum]